MSSLRSIVVVLLALTWSALLVPPQLAVLLTSRRHVFVIPRLYHKGLCRLLKVKVVMTGHSLSDNPALFVLNHISWLDIPVIGSVFNASFVAKEEVAQYPAVGFLSKFQKTLFIARTRPAVKGHKGEMQTRLDQGDSLILFPEGTSSNGVIVKKFNSAFFALAQSEPKGHPLTVQPVSLGYSRSRGFPMTRSTMGMVAWIGDESLLSHIWDYLKTGEVQAELKIHKPVTLAKYDSRKSMATDCHRTVSVGLSEILTGRNHPGA
jgi:lyso-ornithine lipid O-acyltransferase